MIDLPEDDTEAAIPSGRIFDESSTIHIINWCDTSFHMVPVSQLEIGKCFANVSQRTSVVSSR